MRLEPITCASRKRGDVHKIEFGGNIANSITTINTDSMVALPIRQATKKGYIEVPEGGVFDSAYPTSKLRRGRVQGGGMICPALTCEPSICVYEGKKSEDKRSPAVP
jgi:hypothetical protein